jgi:hypothetical protein
MRNHRLGDDSRDCDGWTAFDRFIFDAAMLIVATILILAIVTLGGGRWPL